MEKLSMTITQLSEVAGCSRDTVKRLVKMMFPELKAKRRGIALELNQDQCKSVMDRLPKKNYVGEPSVNAPSNIGQMHHVDYEVIGKMIAVAVGSALQPLVNEIKEIRQEKQSLQLEYVPELPTRKIFIKNIDKLVKKSNSDHSSVYNRVYSEIGYVYGVKVKARAKNRGVRPIDVLESDDLMGKAVAICRQMLEQCDKPFPV